MTIPCQSNPTFGTSHRYMQTAVDSLLMELLHRGWRLPQGSSFLTKCVTTLLPVVLNGHRCCQDTFIQKPLEPLLEKACPLSTSKTKHTCSELRNTLSRQATRFNSHTFCLYHNTHSVILGMRISDRQSSLHHPVRDRNWTDNVDRLWLTLCL